MQANQDITFITDGGEEVRSLAKMIAPASEHVLDWFHITMRITVLRQFAQGLETTMHRPDWICLTPSKGSNGISGMSAVFTGGTPQSKCRLTLHQQLERVNEDRQKNARPSDDHAIQK